MITEGTSAIGVGAGERQPFSRPIPSSVQGDLGRSLYVAAQELRERIKALEPAFKEFRAAAASGMSAGVDAEVVANGTLAFRSVEDAQMRLGKCLQHLDGGVSVYDKGNTLGPTGA
jgi:hypothetical protein